uniref:Uncharacterized protein n=1 Tax=Rhizophora mucronata TaxID=61149 RepID=A0A2P2PYJ4_RHIMU
MGKRIIPCNVILLLLVFSSYAVQSNMYF